MLFAKVSLGHCEHSEVRGWAEKCPVEHGVHGKSPSRPRSPAAQTGRQASLELAPTVAVEFSPEQGTHDDDPLLGWNEPIWHGMHEVDCVLGA